MNVFIVIPTIRTLHFLTTWGRAFKNCTLLVIEDGPEKNIKIPGSNYKKALHLNWNDIKKDFGKDEWIFSRKNAGIRSYGFWKAYTLGADIIITIDDDCFPVDKNFVERHVANLSLKAPDKWTPSYPHTEFMYTRGIPYNIRDKYPAIVSHGLWTNKIDLDAQTQLKVGHIDLPGYPPLTQFLPFGSYFPMCSMNLAFTKNATPLMYFPLMGSDPDGKLWGFDRFDDIWAGIFAKKVLDHLQRSVVNGSPFVEHRKASDPHKNLIKEKEGIIINESLWKVVDKVLLSKKTIAECYLELAFKVKFPKPNYFKKLREAMIVWGNLFLE